MEDGILNGALIPPEARVSKLHCVLIPLCVCVSSGASREKRKAQELKHQHLNSTDTQPPGILIGERREADREH